MTVRRTKDKIHLEGACPVEDAETLLGMLQQTGWLVVDLDGCGRLHTAVVQVLLAAAPPLCGVPRDAFVKTWISTMLVRGSAEGDATGNKPDPL